MTADERLALVRQKINRADKHIDDLKAAVRSFLDSQPYKISTRRDPTTRKLIYYLTAVDPVPDHIPAIAGDILSSLRASLDHLAQQLYIVGTGGTKGYRNQTTFPIAGSAQDFTRQHADKVKGMTRDAIDAIRALEPYAGGKGEDIATFNRLTNIDKHRLIVTVGSSYHSLGIGPTLEASAAGFQTEAVELLKEMAGDLFLRPADNLFPLKAGDELFVDLPDAEAMAIPFRFELVIHEPGVIEGAPIIETLVRFRDRVSGIVDSLKAYLA